MSNTQHFESVKPAGPPLLRRFLAIWLVCLLLLALIIAAFYSVQTKNALAVLKATEREAVQFALQISLTEFINVRSDLLYLTDQYALIDDGSADELSPGYPELAKRYVAFVSRKRLYDRVQFVDVRGQEVVRVDWNNGHPENIPPQRLAKSLDSAYVRQALALNLGDIHLSPPTLAFDDGQIVRPFRPVIRIAAPVADATGRRRGVIVLDYLADNFLAMLRETAQIHPLAGQIWLVDRAGRWMLGPSADDEWGAVLKERASRGLEQKDPQAWEAMRRNPLSGQFHTSKGLYTYVAASPLGRVQDTRTQEYWTIVAHHPESALAAQNRALLQRLWPVAVPLALILALGAWATAYYSLRRNSAEASVRASEARFRSLLEAAPDAIVIVDRAGLMVLVNAQAEKYFGYARGEMLGRPVEILVPSGLRDIHVAHRQSYEENPYTRPMGAGMELFGQRKDGGTFPLEISLSPLSTPQGMLVTAIIRDISARRQAEREREEAQTRYRELMDNLPVGVYRKAAGPDGRFLEVNPALVNMFEAESAEALLAHPSVFRTPADQSLFDGENASIDSIVSEEAELQTLAGRPFWAAVTARLRSDAEGRTYYDGVVEDVTLRKQIARELQRRTIELEATNQELEAFSYSVSHDLRAPLRAIDGFSRILLTDHADRLDDTGRDRLERVRRAAQNMGTLIDDLLKLSRVTRTELKRETVDLSALASEAAEELRRQAPERNVRFAIEPGLQAQGDRGLLRIVLDNLLGNAWKFTGGVPEAHIALGRMPDAAVPTFVVTDNGAGFDMAYAGKLFGVFQRLHNTTQFPGTGIGLATVQRIIHKHGGRIWADSEVGKGSRFYFTLEPEVAT